MLQEILNIINSNLKAEEKQEELLNYHDNDLATFLEEADTVSRMKFYEIVPIDRLSDIISYTNNPEEFLNELGLEKAADVIEEMDSDDASDILEEMDDVDKEKILSLVDSETKEDIELIESYDEDEVGSLTSTNFIEILDTDDVATAMNKLIAQAPENDNVAIIFVMNKENKYVGLIELKKLFIARKDTPLEDIIEVNYPKFYDHEKISDAYPALTDYDLPIYPVLNKKEELIGVITNQDIIELINEELTEDFEKLGAVSDSDYKNSPIKSSMKRLPWLLTLLVLGVLISIVISRFENVVAALPIIIFFQSLVFYILYEFP